MAQGTETGTVGTARSAGSVGDHSTVTATEYRSAVSGAQDDIHCTCGGTCDGVEPTIAEGSVYGCKMDRPRNWCCVRAWVCRECKRRWACRSPGAE